MSKNTVSISSTDVAHILLVDDEVRNLDALEGLPSSSDYSVVRAMNAEEALRALLEQDFAVVLMDVQMPDIDGFELTALIKQRKHSQGIPIIFFDRPLLGYDGHPSRL